MDYLQSENRIREIRSCTKAERDLVSEIDSQISSSYLKGELKLARHWLDDVDNFFLGSTLQERRTVAELSRWLVEAERVLQWAVEKRKNVQDIISKLGPNAESVP